MDCKYRASVESGYLNKEIKFTDGVYTADQLFEDWKKGFDQLSGARSTQKLVEIHNIYDPTKVGVRVIEGGKKDVSSQERTTFKSGIVNFIQKKLSKLTG